MTVYSWSPMAGKTMRPRQRSLTTNSSGASIHSAAPFRRQSSAASIRSWPSPKTSASTWKTAPWAVLAGKRPPSISGSIPSMAMRRSARPRRWGSATRRTLRAAVTDGFFSAVRGMALMVSEDKTRAARNPSPTRPRHSIRRCRRPIRRFRRQWCLRRRADPHPAIVWISVGSSSPPVAAAQHDRSRKVPGEMGNRPPGERSLVIFMRPDGT